MSTEKTIKDRYVISDSSEPFGEGSYGRVFIVRDKVNSNR